MLADYVRSDVSGMRVLRKRAGWTVRPWRLAVAVACTVLLVAAMTVAWALLLLHIAYWHTPTPEPVSWACPAEWVVMPGDTLWRIAKTCWPEAHTGQMVAEIREANPDVDPGRLRAGQTLRLPVATEIVGGAK